MNCVLCRTGGCSVAATGKKRTFFSCLSCGLIVVPPEYQLSIDDERTRYDLHDNTAGNEGYVRFLSQVADIALRHCPPGARMLDFGCGRNAVLTGILRKHGRECDAFDPLYDFPPVPGASRYGCIVMCEVIEHCRDLLKTLEQVKKLCSDDAAVIVRTQCYPDGVDLLRWWYAQDLTHINFFSHRALAVTAELLGGALADTGIGDIYVVQRRVRGEGT